ncbi:MAG: hypothetical protein M3Y54_00310 [Bacteroidota bacterium]|nr:hypothetical protein [Bacteroidota bacterium]
MNQESLSRFVQLFTLNDADATQRVSKRLALVLHDPGAYQTQFVDELVERDIAAELPVQELRDLALLDALLAEDLAWECDDQDKADDLADALNEVLAQQLRPERLRPEALRNRRDPGPEQLDAVQEALEPLGLALVLFAFDSDAYPLSVVAEAQAEETRTLANELGFGVTVY